MPRSQVTVFYGWILVLVMLLLLSVGWGTTVYMFSVVAGALHGEFAPSRAVLMTCSTGMMLMVGLSSPVLGKLLDRYPNKIILALGAISMGLGFIAVALSPVIEAVVLSYILLIGLGMATLSTLTVSTLLSRWFVRRRGLAIGIAALGTQFGGFLYPPIFAAVMESYDWRIALGGLGVIILIVLPLFIWLLIVDRPEQKGLHTDGDSAPAAPPTNHTATPADKLSLLQLFAQRNFLLVVCVVGSAVAANTVLLANLALFATDLGEQAVRGAYLVSLVALLGIFFSPLVGWLSDSINIKIVTMLITASLAISCLIFSVADSYTTLLIAAFFMGVGGGGVFPLWASLVGKLYTTRIYGQVMGATTLVIALLTAIGPPLGGWIHDTTSSYRLLFLILLVLLGAMTLLTTLIRVPESDASSTQNTR